MAPWSGGNGRSQAFHLGINSLVLKLDRPFRRPRGTKGLHRLLPMVLLAAVFASACSGHSPTGGDPLVAPGDGAVVGGVTPTRQGVAEPTAEAGEATAVPEVAGVPPISFSIAGVSADPGGDATGGFIAVTLAHFQEQLQPVEGPTLIDNPETYRVLSNVIYLPAGVQQQDKAILDLWVAPGAQSAPTPLVIYIHGGGFRGGRKAISDGTLSEFLAANISVAAIDYRLTQGGAFPFPTQFYDSAWALKVIRAYIAEANLPIDSERIGLYGGSAGAGLSLWLGFHADMAGETLLTMLESGASETQVLASNLDVAGITLSVSTIVSQSTRVQAVSAFNAQTFYSVDWIQQVFYSDFIHIAFVGLFGCANFLEIGELIAQDPENPEQTVYLYSKLASLSQRAAVEAGYLESSPLQHLTAETAVPVVLCYEPDQSDLNLIGIPAAGGGITPMAGPSAEAYIHNVRFGLILKKRFQDLNVSVPITVYGPCN